MKEIISYGHFRCTELAPHKNRGMEITYIEQGGLEWMVEGVPEKVEIGSVFFTLPWQVHGSIHPREPNNSVWHILFHLDDDYSTPCDTFRFPESLGFTRQEMNILSRAFSGSAAHSFRATPSMKWLIPALIQELQSTHELRDAHSASLLRAILIELKRIVCGEVVDIRPNNLSEKKVQALLADLSADCGKSWTLKAMTTQCGIQRTQLTTLFQKMTGSTPMEYLSRVRVEKAKTLLRETDRKVIDISFECGLNSSQYFANVFKQATGVSPSTYRTHCSKLTPEEMEQWKRVDFRSEQEERKRVQRFISS